LFINLAIAHLTIVEVNIFGMICFPVSIIAAFLIHNEKPTLKEWMGILFIVASIIYSILAP
jgi:drug/metabolite transporter (DMT)-like permease